MKAISTFNQMGWYWNRLRCMSVSEIMGRAGKQASHAMARRREPVSVPQARFERSGARWLPREIPESAGQAVARANATRYGLSASVWTHDGARARRVARAMRSGTVWINTHNKLLPEAETGGFGASGYGRLHGAEAMLEFLETKHVYEDIGRVKPRTEPT